MRGEGRQKAHHFYEKVNHDECTTVAHEFKVVIIGDPKTGKSSLIQSYCQGIFNKTYKATVGIEYAERLIEVEGNLIKLALWDLSGQEMLLKISDRYIKDADGLIFVYDVTEESSFNSFSIWMRYVSKFLGDGSESLMRMPKAVCGNKVDLRHKRAVSLSSAKEKIIPDGVDGDLILEVSARSGKNLNLLFYLLANQMYRNLINGGIRRIRAPSTNILNAINNGGGGGGGLEQEGQAVFDEETYKNSLTTSYNNKNSNGLFSAGSCKPIYKTSFSNDSTAEYSHVFKILLLGASRVGKTSLRFRFCRDYYSSEYFATAGFEYGTRILTCEGSRIRLQIWDVAGDEVYDSTRRGYYKGANAFLVIYDVTNKSSFTKAEKLLKELHSYGHDDAPKILLGNKSDVTKRKVQFTNAQQLADQWQIPLIESSANTGHQVDAAFLKLASALKRQMAPWKKVYDN